MHETIDIAGTIERTYSEYTCPADVIQDNKRIDSGGSDKSGGLRMNVRISVLVDPTLVADISSIRYVKLHGTTKWAVETVQTAYPRLTLALGEVYVE